MVYATEAQTSLDGLHRKRRALSWGVHALERSNPPHAAALWRLPALLAFAVHPSQKGVACMRRTARCDGSSRRRKSTAQASAVQQVQDDDSRYRKRRRPRQNREGR